MVDYIDFDREEIPLGNAFTPVVKKDLPYRDEREFRLLFWRHGLTNQSIAVDTNGVRVPVDLNKLVEKICVSPLVREVPSTLYDILERKKLGDCITRSVIAERPGPDKADKAGAG